MDFFSSFFSGMDFLLNKKKKTQQQQDAFNRGREKYFEQKQKLFDHLRNKPKYHPGKGTYYGDKIYGMEPGDWKQTKPQPTGRNLDLNKGKWKWQYTPDQIRFHDEYHIEGKTMLKIYVPGLFEIFWDCPYRFDGGQIVYFHSMNNTERYRWIKYFLDEKIIPMPMEELI